MNKTGYFALWGGLFVLCAGLGFLPEPTGVLKWALVVLAAAFFVPPLIVLQGAKKAKDWAAVKLLRNLSLLSIGLTVAALILNFMSLVWSEAVGNALYALLVVISTPMVCGQYWLLSLFLWAYLLVDCQAALPKKKKK